MHLFSEFECDLVPVRFRYLTLPATIEKALVVLC
jgi:hypothetical protein